jgi:hypothetical protein
MVPVAEEHVDRINIHEECMSKLFEEWQKEKEKADQFNKRRDKQTSHTKHISDSPMSKEFEKFILQGTLMPKNASQTSGTLLPSA